MLRPAFTLELRPRKSPVERNRSHTQDAKTMARLCSVQLPVCILGQRHASVVALATATRGNCGKPAVYGSSSSLAGTMNAMVA